MHDELSENSLKTTQRCIDLGVDVVEIDFRLTKDGHLVAMHDETVNETANGSIRGGPNDIYMQRMWY